MRVRHFPSSVPFDGAVMSQRATLRRGQSGWTSSGQHAPVWTSRILQRRARSHGSLDCPSQPRPSPISCRRIGDCQRLLRQGFLQQRTGNIRHNQSLPEFGHETAASDFLFRSFRHSLIPRYFEFRCLWISSNRCFRYSRYSCCNLGSLGEP